MRLLRHKNYWKNIPGTHPLFDKNELSISLSILSRGAQDTNYDSHWMWLAGTSRIWYFVRRWRLFFVIVSLTTSKVLWKMQGQKNVSRSSFETSSQAMLNKIILTIIVKHRQCLFFVNWRKKLIFVSSIIPAV